MVKVSNGHFVYPHLKWSQPPAKLILILPSSVSNKKRKVCKFSFSMFFPSQWLILEALIFFHFITCKSEEGHQCFARLKGATFTLTSYMTQKCMQTYAVICRLFSCNIGDQYSPEDKLYNCFFFFFFCDSSGVPSFDVNLMCDRWVCVPLLWISIFQTKFTRSISTKIQKVQYTNIEIACKFPFNDSNPEEKKWTENHRCN